LTSAGKIEKGIGFRPNPFVKSSLILLDGSAIARVGWVYPWLPTERLEWGLSYLQEHVKDCTSIGVAAQLQIDSNESMEKQHNQLP
jgi:hypothetical protein